jgi:hypothetical protein
MKQLLLSVVVAAVATLVTLYATGEDTPSAAQSAPVGLRYTMELVEDAWVNGARTAGIDHKPLAHADTSVCYLTRVQIKSVQGPADSSICRIQVDDFTGFWEVVAEIEEGGQSEVRCNARCLVWEQ